MRLLANIPFIGFGIQTPFQAVEGTAPYTYEVLSGGAGGSIVAGTGAYTAPFLVGIDTIKVTDDDGETTTKQINILSPLGLFCDIIKTELGLEDDQIYIYNQKFNMPADGRLYIAVGVGNVKPFSNINRPVSTESGLQSEQVANFASNHDVNIVSKDEAAIDRKEEVMMSFASDYAQKQMAANNFYVAPLTNQFVNLSDIEGSARLFRFNLSVMLQYAIRKTTSVDYYDTFDEQILIDT